MAEMLTDVIGDFRFGFRKLVRSPGFTVVAVVMLALGIGANTAVFSFLDALLLQTLPVAEPGRLVLVGPGAVGVTGRGDSPPPDHFSYAQFEALHERRDLFVSVAASPTFLAHVTVGVRDAAGGAAQADCQLVSGEYFDMLGIVPFAGRWIGPQDEARSGGESVVVLTYRYWQGFLNGDPDVLGKTLVLQGQPFQIVGVAPPSYEGHVLEDPADFWVPLTMQPTLTRDESRFVGVNRTQAFWLEIMARLAPGVSIEQAEDVVNLEIQRIHTEAGGGELRDFHVSLTPAARGISALRGTLERPLWLLYIGTSLLLLIVCANLANLLLARASDRRNEVGIRLALGAGRIRLVRQLLAESCILAASGAALGLAVASWLMPVIQGIVSQMRSANLVDAELDVRLLAFTAAVGIGTVLLFGAAPALWSLRSGGAIARATGRQVAGDSRGSNRTKSGLVAAQVALSFVLLSCTGLMLRTLVELRTIDTGIAIEEVLYFGIDPQRVDLSSEAQAAMRGAILDRLQGNPYVGVVAFADDMPLSGNFSSSTTEVVGYEPGPEENMNVLQFTVSSGYFDVFHIPLLTGRLFNAFDRYGQTCIVSQAFADRFFPDRSAVGGRIEIRGEAMEIVGVSGNVRQVNLREEPPPLIYHPANGYEGSLDTLIFQARGDAQIAGRLVREAVKDASPVLPIWDSPNPADRVMDRSLTIEHLLSRLTAAFAGLALLLAALGVYGLFSYAVRQRSGEFGVRQALGADRGDVIWLVMRQAGLVLAAGGAVGLFASLFAGRALAGVLYGVSPQDPWTLGTSFAVLIAAGLAAAYAPARRAASVNPADLLRRE